VCSDYLSKRSGSPSPSREEEASLVLFLFAPLPRSEQVAGAPRRALALLRDRCIAALQRLACSAERLGLCISSASGGGRGVGRASGGRRSALRSAVALPCLLGVSLAAQQADSGPGALREVDFVLDASSPMTHPGRRPPPDVKDLDWI
jgi:hypothetical protein